MAADERMPLVGPDGAAKVAAPLHPNSRPISLRGGVKVLVGATLLYVAALASARAFPRGVKGRASAPSPYKGLDVDESSVEGAGLRLDEIDGTTLAPVHVTTAECTGDTSKPAVEGFDLVAYRSLQPGTHGVRGLWEFSVQYGQGYTFLFSTLENKLEFESDPERYLPAWGGFCGFGISHEVVWSPDVLGPPSNPDFWLIEDDRLYLFRSETPYGKFMDNKARCIKHGNQMWTEWFAGNPSNEGTVMTPFNTACFCSEETCADG
ncbi:unnamed protein product [Ectocarpus sp. 8 AP-2014]